MRADKAYCMSSFLMLRTIADHEKTFREGIVPSFYECGHSRTPVRTSEELETVLRRQVEQVTGGGAAALALSGGIDSAILAKFMPKGSVAYTFRCWVPGVDVVDEVPQAQRYAAECGLEHRVVPVNWEDHVRYAPQLMKRKGAPIHSIEVQIHKAALQAKKDGFSTLIFGESADVNFGGHDGLLSRDWSLEEFIERYSYVQPHRVLRKPRMITAPFAAYEQNGKIDVHEFNRHVYFEESMGSYENACAAADIRFSAPYAHAWLAEPLDYRRVRGGESKYMVREIFRRLYPGWSAPAKIPMPRPMTQWLRDWSGPVRPEFLPCCAQNMSGDQKWLLWALETFLNLIDEEG